jgi:hypothetical protein
MMVAIKRDSEKNQKEMMQKIIIIQCENEKDHYYKNRLIVRIITMIIIRINHALIILTIPIRRSSGPWLRSRATLPMPAVTPTIPCNTPGWAWPMQVRVECRARSCRFTLYSSIFPRISASVRDFIRVISIT